MSKPASRVDLAVPFAQKHASKRLGAKWDVAKRVWCAPSGGQALVDRWGCGPPPRRKQRQGSCDTYESRPKWTVDSVRYGPHGKTIVINVVRAPWDSPDAWEPPDKWITTCGPVPISKATRLHKDLYACVIVITGDREV